MSVTLLLTDDFRWSCECIVFTSLKVNQLLLVKNFSKHVLISVTIISPIMLICLSILYYKQCHPWARLLKIEIAKEVIDTNNSGRKSLGMVMSKSEPNLIRTNLF